MNRNTGLKVSNDLYLLADITGLKKDRSQIPKKICSQNRVVNFEKIPAHCAGETEEI